MENKFLANGKKKKEHRAAVGSAAAILLPFYYPCKIKTPARMQPSGVRGPGRV